MHNWNWIHRLWCCGAKRITEPPCGWVRCLYAFDEFKATQGAKDGSFYIVYDGRVLDDPMPTRQGALDVVRAIEATGVAVKWNLLLVLEAGNERGERDVTFRTR